MDTEMKPRYIFSLLFSIVISALVVSGGAVRAGEDKVDKVAVTPFTIKGGDSLKKMADQIREELVKIDQTDKTFVMEDAPSKDGAPKDARLVAVVELMAMPMGDKVMAVINVYEAGNLEEPVKTEVVSGSVEDAEKIAGKMFAIIKKEMEALPATNKTDSGVTPKPKFGIVPSSDSPPPVDTPDKKTGPAPVGEPGIKQPKPIDAPAPVGEIKQPKPVPSPAPAPPVSEPKPAATEQPAVEKPKTEKKSPTKPTEYETITVVGTGVAPIQPRKLAIAKRTARMKASRDAVERAVGAKVDVLAAPDEERRRIISTVTGVARQVGDPLVSEQRGDYYIVKLEMEVRIPREYVEKYPPPAPEKTGMLPAIQPFPKGIVNWADGYLEATGSGKITGNDENDMAAAQRAAQVDAYAVAIEMINGINYDPLFKMSQILTDEEQALRKYHIFGIVQGSEPVKTEKVGNTFQVTVRVPLWGIRGVTVAFLDVLPTLPAPGREKKQPDENPGEKPEGEDTPDDSAADAPAAIKTPKETPGPKEVERAPADAGETYTGLIVDARGTGLQPALLPVIEDEEGNIVYGAGMLTPAAMNRRGVAAYVLEGREKDQGALLGPNPLRIRAMAPRFERRLEIAGVGSESWSAFFTSLAFMPGPWMLIGAEAKVTLRQGDKPATVTAKAADGVTMAKIVVSTNSAKLINQSNSKTNYLAQGRAVVIIDSMVGATEGRNRRGFANDLASLPERYF